MYVITVIPFAKGFGKETLSYFTGSVVDVGSLVTVPLRKKMVEALVVDKASVREMKTNLRQADFTLRKVEKLVSKPFLSEAFMNAAQETARFHAAHIGAALHVLLPKKTLEKMKVIEEKTVIVVPTIERKRFYKQHTNVILPTEMVYLSEKVKEIVIEDPHAPAYKSIGRPFIDFRFALEALAKESGATITNKDRHLLPSVEKTIELHKKEEDTPFTSLGTALQEDLKKGKTLFILATRRGHSGTVLCQDCGTTLTCERCDAPLTLHLKKSKEDFNSLLCHHCGYKTSALRTCGVCGSWKLKAYGLGIERIEEDVRAYLKKHHLKAYVQRIDSSLKLSPSNIRSFISTHFSADCGILIGTEMVLPYLRESKNKNYASYIASLDTLFSLPDFSVNEKIWRLLVDLDHVSEQRVSVQTRNPENALLQQWIRNDESGFWHEEHKARKTFNYPPHGVFIKITVKGKKEKVASEMKKIETQLLEWKPMVFPAFIKTINKQHILHALLVLPKASWVDESLLNLLLSLPPSVRVEVNPRSLL